jgi:hypothetical protein
MTILHLRETIVRGQGRNKIIIARSVPKSGRRGSLGKLRWIVKAVSWGIITITMTIAIIIVTIIIAITNTITIGTIGTSAHSTRRGVDRQRGHFFLLFSTN